MWEEEEEPSWRRIGRQLVSYILVQSVSLSVQSVSTHWGSVVGYVTVQHKHTQHSSAQLSAHLRERPPGE